MTLAQSYLETGRPKPEQQSDPTLFRFVDWTHSFIINRLRAPRTSDEFSADQTAERFVFDADPYAVVSALTRSGALDGKIVFESARMPCTNLWVEYPVRYENGVSGRMGLAVGPIPREEGGVLSRTRTMMAIVGQSKDLPPAPLGLVTLPEFPWREGGVAALVHWFLASLATDGRAANHSEEIRRFVLDLVDSLFLINTPKVCEQREGSFGPRKRKIQERLGKPFIEFRRMVVRVGVGVPHYTGGSGLVGEGDTHRKLHRVLGHFRTYVKDREVPRVAFVPQHWRGDASLGVIIHDRSVKTKG